MVSYSHSIATMVVAYPYSHFESTKNGNSQPPHGVFWRAKKPRKFYNIPFCNNHWLLRQQIWSCSQPVTHSHANY